MTEDVHTSIRRHYERYGRDFSGLDPDAAAGYWHAPSIRVGPDGVRLDATREDRRSGFAAVVEDLAATAYDHSEAVAICSHALSDSLALSNVVWHRLGDDGSILARFSPLHLLRRTDEGWRFVGRATRRSDDPLAMRPAALGERDGGSTAGEGPVASFLEGYARAVSAGDDDAVAAAWTRPALVVDPGGARPVAGGEAVAAPFEEPVGRVEVAAVHACELDDDVALADVLWNHDSGRVASVHLLHETGDGWRFVATARHPPENAVVVDGG